MEVHHHPHVEKKNFKEYFLEFLMIFLAVTMGFFAESIRENIGDHNKEKEFIISMISDAAIDTVNINRAIAENITRASRLDSLAQICYSYSSVIDDTNIYRLYKRTIYRPDFVSLTERTLLQLKNSGGMRLIRKKKAVESIIVYDNYLKPLNDQEVNYEKYLNEIVSFSFDLLNFKLMSGSAPKYKDYSNARLLDTDKKKIIHFGNEIYVFGGVVKFYIFRLQEAKQLASDLINTLKTEYEITKE
jgi:hypothetical protein